MISPCPQPSGAGTRHAMSGSGTGTEQRQNMAPYGRSNPQITFMARNPLQIRQFSGRLGCPADARFKDRRLHGHTLKGCQGFDVSQETRLQGLDPELFIQIPRQRFHRLFISIRLAAGEVEHLWSRLLDHHQKTLFLNDRGRYDNQWLQLVGRRPAHFLAPYT